MTVRVRLFAALRQAAGHEAIEVALPAGATVADLRRRLGELLPAAAGVLPHALFAIEAAYAGDDRALSAGAEVACIPPVSGG
jgi:molybdopterin converting factor small subunit